MYPSGFLPIAVGSVRDQSFPEIYRGSELLQELRNPDAFRGRCGQCEFRIVCGGSRSHAFATVGDPLAEDPSCLYQPALGRGLGLVGEVQGPWQPSGTGSAGESVVRRIWPTDGAAV